jgi:hypothetical protein
MGNVRGEVKEDRSRQRAMRETRIEKKQKTYSGLGKIREAEKRETHILFFLRSIDIITIGINNCTKLSHTLANSI